MYVADQENEVDCQKQHKGVLNKQKSALKFEDKQSIFHLGVARLFRLGRLTQAEGVLMRRLQNRALERVHGLIHTEMHAFSNSMISQLKYRPYKCMPFLN